MKWNDYINLPNLIGKKNEYFENRERETTSATCIWKKQNQVGHNESKKEKVNMKKEQNKFLSWLLWDVWKTRMYQ